MGKPKSYLLGFLLFTLLSSPSHLFSGEQNQRFVCAKKKGKELLKTYNKYPFSSDKSKHCAFSCMLSLECGEIQAYLLGLAKEFHDSLGYGDADAKDLAANKVGLNFAKAVSTEAACLSECDKEF